MPKRQFAISDIHGCTKTFQALLNQIEFTTNDELFLLGDYIDRGPDSKGVIDHIWKLQKEGATVTCLRGNHEQMMLDALTDPKWLMVWLRNGGKNAIQSFGVESFRDIPEEYWTFIKNLHFFKEIENYILVHAGLDFFQNDPYANVHAMLWERQWYPNIDYEWLGDRYIVHGHTPVAKPYIEGCLITLEQQRCLDIDNGCFFFAHSQMNQLCAFDMTNKKLFFQENMDMESPY